MMSMPVTSYGFDRHGLAARLGEAGSQREHRQLALGQAADAIGTVARRRPFGCAGSIGRAGGLPTRPTRGGGIGDLFADRASCAPGGGIGGIAPTRTPSSPRGISCGSNAAPGVTGARRRGAAREPAQPIAIDVGAVAAGVAAQVIAIDRGGHLDRATVRAGPAERAHARAVDRVPLGVEHAALDHAACGELELRHAVPGLELDPARRQIAGRERLGDPPAVRHALDAEHAVVAAARVARRLVVAGRAQLDLGHHAGALVAIDHAPDDDRRRLEVQLDGPERAGADASDPHRARGERVLVREHLVAAFRQLGHVERARRVGGGLDRAADRLAAHADVDAARGLIAVAHEARDRDLARDDDARRVRRHRHVAQLGRQQARALDLELVAARRQAVDRELAVGDGDGRDRDSERNVLDPGVWQRLLRRRARAELRRHRRLRARDRQAGAVDDEPGEPDAAGPLDRDLRRLGRVRRGDPAVARRRRCGRHRRRRVARDRVVDADDRRDDEHEARHARDRAPIHHVASIAAVPSPAGIAR